MQIPTKASDENTPISGAFDFFTKNLPQALLPNTTVANKRHSVTIVQMVILE